MAGVLSPIMAALPSRNHKQVPDCCVSDVGAYNAQVIAFALQLHVRCWY